VVIHRLANDEQADKGIQEDLLGLKLYGDYSYRQANVSVRASLFGVNFGFF
jgi:hypothetical protein